jgi:hypothetical protein
MKSLLVLPLLAVAACAARPALPTSGPYAIKLESFSGENQAKLKTVFDAPTAMVELPETRVVSRPEIFAFLLGDLPFTAGVLRAQGRAAYKMWREEGDPPDEVRFDDTTGIRQIVQLMRRESGRWVFFSKGTYDLGLFTVYGRSAFIVLVEERGGALWTQARVYAKVEGVVLEQGARFLGLVEGVLRRKSFAFIEAASKVAEAAAAEPGRLYRDVKGSAEVDSAALEEFRRRFVPDSE